MDSWHVILALCAYFVVMKLYLWCQMCYWRSPEFDEVWADHLILRAQSAEPEAEDNIEEINNAGPNLYHDSDRVFYDEPALRESGRETVGG